MVAGPKQTELKKGEPDENDNEDEDEHDYFWGLTS
jgi:hypothetical protein